MWMYLAVAVAVESVHGVEPEHDVDVHTCNLLKPQPVFAATPACTSSRVHSRISFAAHKLCASEYDTPEMQSGRDPDDPSISQHCNAIWSVRVFPIVLPVVASSAAHSSGLPLSTIAHPDPSFGGQPSAMICAPESSVAASQIGVAKSSTQMLSHWVSQQNGS